MSNNDKTRAAVTYERICTRLEIEGNGISSTYGIMGKDPSGRVVADIADVSPDAEAVRRLVGMLNKNTVSYIHAKDVVEDFILML